MKIVNWNFAMLESEQLDLVREGEVALGVDFLVAYRQEEGTPSGYVELFLEGLNPAHLEDSEIECLEGLEQRLQATVVAYMNKA